MPPTGGVQTANPFLIRRCPQFPEEAAPSLPLGVSLSPPYPRGTCEREAAVDHGTQYCKIGRRRWKRLVEEGCGPGLEIWGVQHRGGTAFEQADNRQLPGRWTRQPPAVKKVNKQNLPSEQVSGRLMDHDFGRGDHMLPTQGPDFGWGLGMMTMALVVIAQLALQSQGGGGERLV